MTETYIYKDMMAKLLAVCKGHIEGQISGEQFRQTVLEAETTILAVSERDIRNYMTDVESRIELVKFTIPLYQQLAGTKKIAQEVLSWIHSRNQKFMQR